MPQCGPSAFFRHQMCVPLFSSLPRSLYPTCPGSRTSLIARLIPALLPYCPCPCHWLGPATGLPVHRIQIIAEYHRHSVATAHPHNSASFLASFRFVSSLSLLLSQSLSRSVCLRSLFQQFSSFPWWWISSAFEIGTPNVLTTFSLASQMLYNLSRGAGAG